MRLLSCFLLTSISLVTAQRWYYTGKFTNDEPTPQYYAGGLLDYDSLFNPSGVPDERILYSGGLVLALVTSNGPMEAVDEEFLHSLCALKASSGQLTDVTEEKTHVFGVYVSENYPPALNSTTDQVSIPMMEAEIGLFDNRLNKYTERKWITITNGNITSAVVVAKYSSGEAVVSIRHKVVWMADLFGRRALVLHTWDHLEEIPRAEHIDPTKLRVMTYNLWHNNPLSWVYQDKKERWARYDRRIAHFAEVVVAQDPDVVALQEVRMDSNFFTHADDNTMGTWTGFDGYRKKDAGAQVEHLLLHLKAAQERLGLRVIDYQVVFQPAMFMFDKARMHYRNEEGLLILSKHTIRHHQALFLPRDLGNKGDDHQRMVVVAEVEVPTSGGGEIAVTVATTHLSLLNSSRIASADELLTFLTSNPHASRTPVQIFTGDLNAEPHEDSVHRILGKDCDMEAQTCSQESGFLDSWVEANAHLSTEDGHTFPACDPVKRIDYIFVRNNSCADCKHTAVVVRSYITGSRPTEDTEHLIGSREGLGMNDMDSPLWASDHFAVVTDLHLFQHA